MTRYFYGRMELFHLCNLGGYIMQEEEQFHLH